MYPFILLLGLVSFFADITYEGARSITGPFMALLGASGAVVGMVAGLGEFMGYGMRLVSGMIADKTRQYWVMTFIGYLSNLVVVPLLALAHRWETAAVLIVLERMGKGIRTPSRDAMLSYASQSIGRGWGFGIHQAMDRCGALLGPLFLFLILSHNGGFRLSFALLGIPAAFALGALYYAKKRNPHPQTSEERKITLGVRGFSKPFWIFLAAAGLVGAGYVDFALVAYHFQKQAVIPTAWIPLFYAVAMISAIFFSLVGGKLFDFFSKPVVIAGLILGAVSAPFMFWGKFNVALAGMLLWGIGLGMQGSVLRSIVANMVGPEKRSSAYGLFGVVFGLCWFLGSSLLGWLYDHSLALMMITSVVLQAAAIPLFLKIKIEA